MKLISLAAPGIAAAAITCTAILIPSAALASAGSPARGADLAAALAASGRAGAATGTRANCTWAVRALPDLAGSAGGQVLGTDGGSRFVGTSGADALLWSNRHLTDLGAGRALDVNRAGIAVGADSANLDAGHAVLWRGRGTKPVRLPEPAGVTTSVAVGITDSGMIVGTGQGPNLAPEGLVWSVRAPHRVRALTSSDGYLVVNGVSNNGLIVGGDIRSGDLRTTAVAGTLRSGLHPLPATASGGDSIANAAAGRYVVGSQGDVPVLWVNRSARLLPGVGGDPLAVNRHGLAGGIDFATFGPVVWRHGVMIALPASAGGGQVTAVTDRGEAGGTLGNGAGPVTWTCR